MTYDPFTHAESLGISVVSRPFMRKGGWLADRRLIVLRAGMSDVQTRCTLAHEVQHAIHGDRPTPFGPVHAMQERRADRAAALLLVDPAEYAAAEALYGPHGSMIAHELGLTEHMLNVWRATLALAGHVA